MILSKLKAFHDKCSSLTIDLHIQVTACYQVAMMFKVDYLVSYKILRSSTVVYRGDIWGTCGQGLSQTKVFDKKSENF